MASIMGISLYFDFRIGSRFVLAYQVVGVIGRAGGIP